MNQIINKIIAMNQELRRRSASLNTLGYSSLRDLRQAKKTRIIQCNLFKLKSMRNTYEQAFHKPKQDPTFGQDKEQQQVVFNRTYVKDDFQSRCRKICNDLCFHLAAFQKIFSENLRKKSIIVKFYGWEKEFQDIFFQKNKEELRHDLTPTYLYDKLNLSHKTFTTRNNLNKLRLFLTELITTNKRQQQLQSKFLKMRLGSQLSKLNKEMVQIIQNKERNYLRGYVDEIGRTHEMMLNCKVKSKNQTDNLMKIEQETGKISISQFYSKEEDIIDDVEKYFTRIRLQKQS